MLADKNTLIAAMKLPPEKAVEYLRSKGVQVTDSWRDLWQIAHRRAFTVARSAGFDVLDDIKSALNASIDKGLTYQQFAKQLTPVLQSKGWWGKAIDKSTGEIIKTYDGTSRPVEYGSPRRLKLIYEQNVQTAFMAGRYREMKGAAATHPYWEYVALLDNKTRPSHRAMHGRVFRHDDVVWSIAYPPCGWRCRCKARARTARDIERLGVTVSTASGHITVVQVPQRDGTQIAVKRIQVPGMPIPLQPDPGWDYNPAIALDKVPG